MRTRIKNRLPRDLKPLFWSYHTKNFDLKHNKKTVMLQIINYGNWTQWKWLVKIYGEEEIKHFVAQTPITEFRPGALKLIATILSIHNFNYASRGSY